MCKRLYSVSFVGDAMLGRLIDQLCPTHVQNSEEAEHVATFLALNPGLRNYEPATPWGETLPLLSDSDLNVINLETSVITRDRPWPRKVFNCRMHPANIEALRIGQIGCASFANNHSLDYGEKGLKHTVEVLEKEHVNYAEVGSSRAQATKSTVLMMSRAEKEIRSLTLKAHEVAIWAASDYPKDWAGVQGFH